MALRHIRKNIGENNVEKKEKMKYSDSDIKVDKLCHYKNEDMGTMAKKTTLPGQMYVPKKVHNESSFSGEER